MKSRTAVFLGSFCLVLGAFVGRLPNTITQVRALLGSPDWAAAFHDAVAIIRDRYVEQPDEEALYRGAIRGAAEALNDPYTEFIPPADRANFEKELTGQFVGIGASVNVIDGWLTIVFPLEGSPTLRAGLLPGDQVRAIDGKSTQGLTVDACIKLLVGQPGTPVRLTIAREGLAEPIDVTITRARIEARSVRGFRYNSLREDWDYTLDHDRRIAYIRIDQFTPGVADEFRNALAAAGGSQCGGLVIDLRDNPGGLLDQAVEIVDAFLASGDIVSTRGRSGQGQLFRAAPGVVGDMPIAVLVNQNSASASEIVAGALADNRRATVIGTRSFGKGLVQRIEPLPSVPGAQLKLTEQHYYLPSGRLIQRTDDADVWGVDPTDGFYVPLTDAQQRQVFLLKREMGTIRPSIADGDRRIPAPPIARERELAATVAAPLEQWADPQWIEQTLQDPQLAAAIKAVQLRVASGTWTPTGTAVPDQSRAIAGAELTRLQQERTRIDLYISRLDDRIEALIAGSADPASSRPRDLWTGDPDLSGGRMEVFDKDGRRIATLDITGPDVERWLLDADLKPQDQPADVGTTPTPAEAPAEKPGGP